jgi:hypothetical protein
MRFRITGVSERGELREKVIEADEGKAALQQARAQGVFALTCVLIAEIRRASWRQRALERIMALRRPGYWRGKPIRILSLVAALLTVGLWIESYHYLDYFETPQWAHCSFVALSVRGAAEIDLIYSSSPVARWRGIHEPIQLHGTEMQIMQTRGHWYTLWLGMTHEKMFLDPSGQTVDFYNLGVPYWLATGVFIVAGCWPFWPYRRHYAKGLCPACGYDLRATPQQCPECGRRLEGVGAPNRLVRRREPK